jgi:hypothetical protein
LNFWAGCYRCVPLPYPSGSSGNHGIPRGTVKKKPRGESRIQNLFCFVLYASLGTGKTSQRGPTRIPGPSSFAIWVGHVSARTDDGEATRKLARSFHTSCGGGQKPEFRYPGTREGLRGHRFTHVPVRRSNAYQNEIRIRKEFAAPAGSCQSHPQTQSKSRACGRPPDRTNGLQLTSPSSLFFHCAPVHVKGRELRGRSWPALRGVNQILSSSLRLPAQQPEPAIRPGLSLPPLLSSPRATENGANPSSPTTPRALFLPPRLTPPKP